MNDRSAFLQGGNWIEDSRQLLVTNVNELKRRFGLFKRIRCDRRDPLTHKADALLG
jgi:hypothetical protein